jgi:periplasmic copper chaperone A
MAMAFFRLVLGACLLAGLPLTAWAGTPNVTVSNPWIRYLLPNIPAGGYMVLQNSGDGDAVLTGASSPDCGSLMLHQSQDSSGMAMMMDVQSVTVPAKGKVGFAPGGYHLMCMQPKMKIGQRVPVTLNFQGGFNILLTMPVYGASGAP